MSPVPEGAYSREGKDEVDLNPVGLEVTAITALNTALGGVWALNEVIQLMGQAADKLAIAKSDIDAEHMAAIKDIVNDTGNAKVELSLWVDNAEKDIQDHADASVMRSVNSNIQSIASAVLRAIDERGYG
jgi:hypothetical protein